MHINDFRGNALCVSLLCDHIDGLQPLASAYGLAKHRDGRWEWAIAPGVSPSPRYQHAAVSYLSVNSVLYMRFLFLLAV